MPISAFTVNAKDVIIGRSTRRHSRNIWCRFLDEGCPESQRVILVPTFESTFEFESVAPSKIPDCGLVYCRNATSVGFHINGLRVFPCPAAVLP